MKKPLASPFFAGTMFLFGLLVLSGPAIRMVVGGYDGAWFPVIVVAGSLGVLGALGATAYLAQECFFQLFKSLEKKLVARGYQLHWGWGLGLGLMAMLSAVSVGTWEFVTLIQAGAPSWLVLAVGVTTGLAICAGLALARLHNLMAQAMGVKFFL